jgi:hypothetical protein
MNRRGFLAGMLAAPFVAKAELLMPVQKVVVPEFTTITSEWFDLGMHPAFLFLKHIDVETGKLMSVSFEQLGGWGAKCQ